MIIDCHNRVGADLLFYLPGDFPYARLLVQMKQEGGALGITHWVAFPFASYAAMDVTQFRGGGVSFGKGGLETVPYAFENRRLIEESQKLFPEEGKRVLPCVMVDPMRSTDAQAAELIKTPLTSVWMESRANDLLNHCEKKSLLGHVGKAEDCAGAVTFLCSPAASYITDEIIVIDGGLTTSQIGKR